MLQGRQPNQLMSYHRLQLGTIESDSNYPEGNIVSDPIDSGFYIEHQRLK